MKKLLEKLETFVDEATLLVREERARRSLAAAKAAGVVPTVNPPSSVTSPGCKLVDFAKAVQTAAQRDFVMRNADRTGCAPNVYPAWSWSGMSGPASAESH